VGVGSNEPIRVNAADFGHEPGPDEAYKGRSARSCTTGSR
jgi:hypothetical protein